MIAEGVPGDEFGAHPDEGVGDGILLGLSVAVPSCPLRQRCLSALAALVPTDGLFLPSVAGFSSFGVCSPASLGFQPLPCTADDHCNRGSLQTDAGSVARLYGGVRV